ncbi:MAG: hypothetical protein ABI599_17375 [Flavobacteriales bacterium]
MRALLIPALLLLAPLADASNLTVDVRTVKAHATLVRPCHCSGAERSVSVPQEMRTFPGSIALDVSGGVAPYRIIWHAYPWLGGEVFIADAGMHRVTVVDANGESVTRSIHVGKKWSYVKRKCPDVDNVRLVTHPTKRAPETAAIKPEKIAVFRLISDMEPKKTVERSVPGGAGTRKDRKEISDIERRRSPIAVQGKR